MATVKDVPPGIFIPAFAAHLKKQFDDGKLDLPEWHSIVKTGKHKEYAPQSDDWYFVRAAALARKVYLRGGTGVGAFSKVFGGRYRRGAKKERFSKGARGLIRHILRQLEELELVATKDEEKGRFITAKGKSALNTIAAQCIANS